MNQIPTVCCIFYKAQWQAYKLDHHDIPVRLCSSFSDQTVFTAVVMQQKQNVVQNLGWVLFNLWRDEKLDHL